MTESATTISMGSAQQEFDVIVVGSGAGGLSAAVTARKLGLSVIVLEKEAVFGGTTARSGGVLWIPCNALSRELGIQDSIEAARTYLQHEAGTHFDAARVDAFLEQGPRMIDFFRRETEVDFIASPGFADYHPDAPGGVSGGRSIVAAPLDGRLLAERIRDLSPPLREITFVGMMFNSSQEVGHFFTATRSLKSARYVSKRLLQHGYELLRYGRPMRLTNGNALAARLLLSALRLGMPMRLSTPVRRLIVEDGAVVGVEIDAAPGILRARRGVVLAAGGFPHDVARRKALMPHAPNGTEHFSPAPPGNSGDGLRLAQDAGADLIEDLPNTAAWIPVSRITHRDGATGVFPHLIDRYKPGILAVTRHGERFVNEANSYHDFGQAMQRVCAGEEVCAFLICDHTALRRYGMGFVKPFPIPYRWELRSGYLLRGRTLAELAQAAGINAAALQRTVEHYNIGARNGEDAQFGKGSTAYNRYLGDAAHQPNPCVAPLQRAPFYAIKVVIGDLGTFAGIRTDQDARVLDRHGRPIAGLYAAGNDAASVMGGNYPAGGITLGPAMTFGYIAAQHLAHEHATRDSAREHTARDSAREHTARDLAREQDARGATPAAAGRAA